MRNTFLVFKRDYLGYVQAWGFWLGIISVPIVMVLAIVFIAYASAATPDRYYTVIESGTTLATAIDNEYKRDREASAREVQALTGLSDAEIQQQAEPGSLGGQFIRVDAPANTIDGLRPYLLGTSLVNGPDGERPLFAAIIVGESGADIEYWSEDVNVSSLRLKVASAAERLSRENYFKANNIDPSIIEQADKIAPEVLQRRIRTVDEQITAGNDVTTADRAPFFISLAIAYVLWLMIFSVIQYLLMGTIEERSNKIFDTLLTSVRLPQLLAGKLGAVFAVTSTMMGAWAIVGIGSALFGASFLDPEDAGELSAAISAGLSPSIIIPALISFVLGYLMYGVVFMALGSLCDTIQEAQTLLSPLMLLLMMPMFMIMIAFNDPGSPIVAIVSWIPLFTPFLLILRMPTEPPLWEVLAQIGIMAVTTVLILWLATKVYRAGAVHGAGISDAMAWLKGLIPGLGKKKAEETIG